MAITAFSFLAMTLTEAQQAKHDTNEWAIYQLMQSDEVTIANIWRPNAKLFSDYCKLRKCYLEFHLYRANDCNAELLMSTSISANRMSRGSKNS